MVEAYVRVPVDLGVILRNDGFDEVEVSRDPGRWIDIAEVAWTVGEQAISVASGLVTVAVAREQIGSFLRALAFWIKRSAPSTSSVDQARLTVTVTLKSDHGQRRLDAEVTEQGDISVADTEAVRQVLVTLLNTTESTAQHQVAPPGSGPS